MKNLTDEKLIKIANIHEVLCRIGLKVLVGDKWYIIYRHKGSGDLCYVLGKNKGAVSLQSYLILKKLGLN